MEVCIKTSLRKFTKNKRVFPTDDTTLKAIYLATKQIEKKWQNTRNGWPKNFIN